MKVKKAKAFTILGLASSSDFPLIDQPIWYWNLAPGQSLLMFISLQFSHYGPLRPL